MKAALALLALAFPAVPMPSAAGKPQVRWHVDAGRAKEGVSEWVTHVHSLGAISGLYGCCGRFRIAANGSFFDEWPEAKYPLSDWDFVHELDITMHFVFTVEQSALMNRTALLAIPDAVRIAVAHNFTGYALDYETTPAGPPGSAAFALESDGLLAFATQFSAALVAAGKELVIDVGGTTAASLSTQTAGQCALAARWGKTGVSTLMEMGTYYGTDLGFNQRWLLASMAAGVPAHMLSSGIGSTTTAGCGCGFTAQPVDNRSCCAPGACCGPAQDPWAAKPPTGPPVCHGPPCGDCRTLGTDLGCYNWTASSLRSYATFLARHNISQIGIFMATIDQVEDPGTEGRNETSPFFYDVMRDFLRGALKTGDEIPRRGNAA